jgi:AcrR family transcriptional regulator
MSLERTARERILDAACELIADEGIDEVRIARVAMRAGISTALVHHYFSTRDELLAEALLHSFELAGDERFGAPARSPATTAGQRLGQLIEECLPLPGGQEREWILWVELWLRAVRDPELRPVAARLYERYREWVAEAVAAGIESGEFEPVDPGELADQAMALFDGFGIRALLGDPQMPIGRMREQATRLLAAPLGVDPAALAAPPQTP